MRRATAQAAEVSGPRGGRLIACPAAIVKTMKRSASVVHTRRVRKESTRGARRDPPSPLGEGVARSATDEGSRAKRDVLSAQGRSNGRHRKLRRTDHKVIRQAQDRKALPPRPMFPRAALRLSFGAIVPRPIDLQDQPSIHAQEVDDEIADRRLTAKLRAFAAPVADGAPNDRLGLDVFARGLRARSLRTDLGISGAMPAPCSRVALVSAT